MSPGEPALRALFLDEGVLGGRTLMASLQAALAGVPDVDASFATVPQETRVERRLLGRIGRIGHADLQALRWRLRWSWRARDILASYADTADVALINTQSCALLSRGPMGRLPSVLSVDATARQYTGLEYGGPRDRWSPFQDRLLSALERRAVDAAAGVVAWTRWNAAALRAEHDVPAERLVTLHPGLDAAWWGVAAGQRPATGSGPLRVLFVGNDVRRKGLDTLTAAIDRLDGAAELDVATGDAVAESARVHVHRGLSAQTEPLRDLYARADVLALPTQADAVPWVVLEAMASGMPVVASDVGAIGELLGGCGELTAPGDVDGVASALAALAGDPERRRALGQAARERVAERYDRARQLPRLLAVLRAAAKRQPLVVEGPA